MQHNLKSVNLIGSGDVGVDVLSIVWKVEAGFKWNFNVISSLTFFFFQEKYFAGLHCLSNQLLGVCSCFRVLL